MPQDVPTYFADTPEPCSFCKELTLWRWLPAPDLRANGQPLCETCFRAALEGFAKSQERGFQRDQPPV